MKSLACKLMLSFLGLSAILACSCTTPAPEAQATAEPAEQQMEAPAVMEEKSTVEEQKKDEKPADKPMAQAQKPKEIPAETKMPAVEAPDDVNIVATIGDYAITRNEFEKKLRAAIIPNRYNTFEEAKPVIAHDVLIEMLTEKAIIIEARELGLSRSERISSIIQQFKEPKIANLMLNKYVMERLKVTDSDIDEKLKADPNMSRERAKMMVQREKGREIVNKYYDEIYKKRNVQKFSESFPKALQIHNRLLNKPVKERKLKFIHKYQITDEMTQEERDLLLSAYEGGKFTLKDWLETLCRFSPPSRPKMETPKDVETLLDRALKLPIYVAEATSQGFDKDKNLIKQTRDYEDRVLLGEVRRLKTANVNDPTIEEIVTYFQNNKEEFGETKTMKIDVIWCQDLETAQKVKAEIDGGKDFESAKQQYALNKKMKAFTTRPYNEGLFWDELWAAEPNDVLGPLKGYDGRDIKWRIVQILEKKPGKIKEYTEKMNDNIKRRMTSLRREEIMDEYGEEALKKHPYQIYEDRIENIDPWDIP
jgi:hypothetical protein